jgi:ferrous iron transport protein A
MSVAEHDGIQTPRDGIPLSSLCGGDEASICLVGGPPEMRTRLRTLGIREGERIVVIKCAPLADPIEYSVGGMHVSLRRSEAGVILVRDVRHSWGRGDAGHGRGWSRGRAGRGHGPGGRRCAPGTGRRGPRGRWMRWMGRA